MLKEIRYEPKISGSVKYQDADFYQGNKEFIHMLDTEHFRFPDEMHVCVDARVGFRKHPHNITLNSQTGSDGSTVRDITTGPLTDRMEVVADPLDASKVCWKLQAHKDDIDAQSLYAKRAEFNTSKNRLLSGETYTVGYKFMLDDYRTTTDSFLIQQFKGLDSEVPFSAASPWLSLSVLAGKLIFQIRKSNAASTDDEIVHSYEVSDWVPSVWYSVVVEAQTSLNVYSNGSVKVWLNGVLVINYTGLVGYYTQNNYVMCGIYQWGNPPESWPWDMNFPMKTMRLKGVYVVAGSRAEEMYGFIKPL